MTKQKRLFRTIVVRCVMVTLFLSVAKGHAMNDVTIVPNVKNNVWVVDDLKSTANFRMSLGENATMVLSTSSTDARAELCMDYRLAGSHSHALICKDVDVVLPDNFEIRLLVKRSALENHMELKLVDGVGNTYMKKWYMFGSVGNWTEVVIGKHELLWAWGADSGTPLKRIKTIEFGVTGKNNTGQVCLAQFELAALRMGDESVRQGKKVSGLCPRWLSNQQAYWTMVGVVDDDNEVLFCEDGSVEPIRRGPAVLPVLVVNGQVVTREDVQVEQALLEKCLPIPSVKWISDSVELDVQLFAHGKVGESVGYAKYTVSNTSPEMVAGQLLLLVQPYQVYPPWQGGGGFSPIHQINYVGRSVVVNGTNLLYLSQAPDNFVVSSENNASGSSVEAVLQATEPFVNAAMTDDVGLAAGALVYNYVLQMGESVDFFVQYPLHNAVPPQAALTTPKMESYYTDSLRATAEFWRARVNRISIRIDEPELMDVFRANVAYNLITKDGPAIQPGARSYEKSWMRDGSIAAVALLEAGETNAPREFIEWFAEFQYDTGEVPPIIDTRAEDPLWEEKEKGLIEYDSQGEFIWLIMQYYRYTHDLEFLKRMFPRVMKSVKFMMYLRRQRMTDYYSDEASPDHVFYGLLPKSTSHEGYDLKHSYWDDFWGLKGFEDAYAMAEILEETNRLSEIEREYADFKKSVYDSIALVVKRKGIDYMPGCAELGDLDPTSTAASIIYCDQLKSLPQKELQGSFDRFEIDINNRLRPGSTYRFTPYEIRTVAAYVRLGKREMALRLLRFMLDHRRPKAWNHLAEVAHSDYRYPCYIGDMPHTWVGAEFIIAVRTLFAYEEGDTLVLGAGIDPAWIKDGKRIEVENLPTQFGTLSYEMYMENGEVRVDTRGDVEPAGGFILKAPSTKAKREM